MRQVYQLLPAVLVRDQPGSGAAVAHVLRSVPPIDFERAVSPLGPLGAQKAPSMAPLRALKASLAERGDRLRRDAVGLGDLLERLRAGGPPSGELRRHLQAREPAVIAAGALTRDAARQPTRWRRLTDWMRARWELTTDQLAVATQVTLSFFIVMLLTVVDATYYGLNGRTGVAGACNGARDESLPGTWV